MNLQELQALFDKTLPGELAHLELMPTRVGYSQLQYSERTFREAAVSIILFEDSNQKLKTIIIKRQEYDGNHSGQFGFPGGKKELSDSTLLDTACRECFEEIGVNPQNMILLREITPVYIPISNFVVHPFVFYSKRLDFNYVPSDREVQSIHEVELIKLLSSDSLIYKDVKTHKYLLKRVPHFEMQSVSVWGATALMLNEIKHVLNSDKQKEE